MEISDLKADQLGDRVLVRFENFYDRAFPQSVFLELYRVEEGKLVRDGNFEHAPIDTRPTSTSGAIVMRGCPDTDLVRGLNESLEYLRQFPRILIPESTGYLNQYQEQTLAYRGLDQPAIEYLLENDVNVDVGDIAGLQDLLREGTWGTAVASFGD